jgi:hypothetical protein
MRAEEQLAENLAAVRQRIATAAARSGRQGDEVTLVAVTKYVDDLLARKLVDLGCRTLGESRPQELWGKAELLNDLGVQWHLIGHLQRNKARRTLPLVECVHSGDSERLLHELNEIATGQSPRLRVLLEVNISGDTAKHGLRSDEVEPLLPGLAQLEGIDICGLMSMASRDGGVDAARRDFAKLRQLRETLAKACPESISLRDLSMGMSGDFDVAIEEGATIVRVGSALFEGIEK